MLNPITRVENFLARIAGDPGVVLTPKTRIEHFLQRIIDTGGGGGSVTVDDELSLSSENPVQNKVITTALGNKADATALSSKADKPTTTAVTGATPTIAAADNTIYECGELTFLTVSSFPASGSFSIVFTSGSTATTTSFPATLLGLDDFAAETNTLYEINVLDGRAVVGSWAVSSS